MLSTLAISDSLNSELVSNSCCVVPLSLTVLGLLWGLWVSTFPATPMGLYSVVEKSKYHEKSLPSSRKGRSNGSHLLSDSVMFFKETLLTEWVVMVNWEQ